MTFKEKWLVDHPNYAEYMFLDTCPYKEGYEADPCPRCYEQGFTCSDCWNRELPNAEKPSPTKLKYNVNYHMYVKLTNYGKELIIKKHGYDYFEACIESCKQENGYYQLQCHEVMSLFGDHIGNGCKLPFEPTVYFDSKDLESVQEEALE